MKNFKLLIYNNIVDMQKLHIKRNWRIVTSAIPVEAMREPVRIVRIRDIQPPAAFGSAARRMRSAFALRRAIHSAPRCAGTGKCRQGLVLATALHRGIAGHGFARVLAPMGAARK